MQKYTVIFIREDSDHIELRYIESAEHEIAKTMEDEFGVFEDEICYIFEGHLRRV